MIESRSLPARIFLSPDERRLRSGWRLLLHAILTIALIFVFFYAIIVILNFIVLPRFATDALPNVLQLLAFTLGVYIARRLFDRRTFASLGLHLTRLTWLDLVAGIFISGLQMGFIFLVELTLGWITIGGLAPGDALAGLSYDFVRFLGVGWQEELLTRGYWLQNLASGLGLWPAVIVSSVGFALLHLGNPEVSLAAIIGLIGAGLYLAYGYTSVRRLWLPIGLHIGWNFFEGTVFGFPVSGTDSFRLMLQTQGGPELWTGGRFGPEAGLIVLPSLLFGALLIWLYSRAVRKDPSEQRTVVKQSDPFSEAN